MFAPAMRVPQWLPAVLLAWPVLASADTIPANLDSLAAAVPESVIVLKPRGVTDSVTVLPPVIVQGDRVQQSTRNTATQVRMNRG